MLSFWERESFTTFDFIIVGGGITGLSTALSLKEKQSQASVLVLERGIWPSGASTRNAGFACYGSAAEILADIKKVGETKALELVALRKNGLERLLSRLGADCMDYIQDGGGEFLKTSEGITRDHWEYLNSIMHPIFGVPVFKENPERVKHSAFGMDDFDIFIENTVEGQIDTGKTMRALMELAAAKGVMMLSGCEVKSINHDDLGVYIQVKAPIFGNDYIFKAQKCAVTTNAFLKQLLPELDVKPGRGQILITKPIEALPFQGIYHFDEGYYYFRNIGNRVLFGGGRNLNFEGEATAEFGITDQIQSALEYHLTHTILPGRAYEIEMRWSGIMAFGEEKWPILKTIGSRMVVAGRMNGMGIAIGSEVGAQAADKLLYC